MRRKNTGKTEKPTAEDDFAVSAISDDARKYSVMFGFRGASDMETTGYLNVEDGYSVVCTIDKASLFERENYSGKEKWASPADWAGFFNSDDELCPWIFHPVGTTRIKENT